MKVSVIIPSFNEENGIKQTIKELKDVLDEQRFVYEIIVVDDGSTDHTVTAALETGVKVFSHKANLGYGASIKTGVQNSLYEAILISDADGTYPATEVPHILKELDHYDMVVGARTGNSISIPLLRRPPKWVLTKLANYLSESNIPDLNSGLRAVKKEIFYKFMRLFPNGFSLTTTLTLAVHTNHLKVKYIPINYRPRTGKSKIKPIRDTLNFFLLIVRTSLLFNPLKIFLSVSLIMMVAAFLVFICSLFFLPYTLDITAVVLFIGGLQMLATGMIADLINKRME